MLHGWKPKDTTREFSILRDHLIEHLWRRFLSEIRKPPCSDPNEAKQSPKKDPPQDGSKLRNPFRDSIFTSVVHVKLKQSYHLCIHVIFAFCTSSGLGFQRDSKWVCVCVSTYLGGPKQMSSFVAFPLVSPIKPAHQVQRSRKSKVLCTDFGRKERGLVIILAASGVGQKMWLFPFSPPTWVTLVK